MNCKLVHTAVIAILLATAAHAQSLGEVARQQKRQKSDPQAAPTPKKVYTEEDFGESDPADKSTSPADAKHSTTSANEREKKALSAEQWKAKIQKKKDLIAAVQERIDKLEGSVNYVQNNRNIYTNAPEYNEHQHQKELAAQRLKAELEQQKSELSDLQEQARQQGFGNAVYQ